MSDSLESLRKEVQALQYWKADALTRFAHDEEDRKNLLKIIDQQDAALKSVYFLIDDMKKAVLPCVEIKGCDLPERSKAAKRKSAKSA